jgi:hypothetical protein
MSERRYGPFHNDDAESNVPAYARAVRPAHVDHERIREETEDTSPSDGSA